jgi:fluoroacetyl-CoA thioesterase
VAIHPGLHAAVETTVGAADTALALGSGEVEVLGTPRVLALVEAATVAAVADRLDPSSTTVGSRVELEHLAPSPVGAAVRADAVLAEVAGRRLGFTVTLSQGGRHVARGTVVRVVVDRARFGTAAAQASTEERG